MYHANQFLFFLLLLFISCSNEIEIGPPPLPIEEAPVPIRISSEWIEASTKAKVDAFTTENIKNTGIFGTSGSTILYKGISPDAIDNGQFVFHTTSLVYPVNGDAVALSGYFPKNIGEINEDGLFHFTLTGKEDLMYASPQDAGNKTSPESVNLLFNHKLTCVSFKLKNGITGNLITPPTGPLSLIVQAANQGTLKLTTGEVKAESATSIFTLNSTLTLADLVIGADAKSIAGEFMLLPAKAYVGNTIDYSFQLAIDNLKYAIKINNTYKPAWEEGKSYELTITINGLTALTDNPITKSSTNYELTGTICERTK